MKEFKTVIIDDERLAREELKSVLKDFVEINIIDEAQNGDEGIEKIKQHRNKISTILGNQLTVRNKKKELFLLLH